MVFLVCTVSSLILVFSTTLYNFINLEDSTDIVTIYHLLDDQFYHNNKMLIKATEIFVMAFTLFFLMPLALLIFVQIKNFCNNRTTNERFGNKRYNKKKVK